MSSAGTPDPDVAGIDGMTNYVELSGDKSDIQEGASVYKGVAGAVRSNVPPGEACQHAFPSMIVRPDGRMQCFVAAFASKLIIAWQKGMFRKATEVEVIPTSEITTAMAAVSSSSVTSGALLMTIEAGKTVTFALPANRIDIGDAIRSALTLAVW